MQTRASKGYLAALAVAASIILVAGHTLRPAVAPPAPAISETERVRLQNLAQRQGLQRRTEMLADFARELSDRARRYLREPASVPYREPQVGETLLLVTPVDSGPPLWITGQFAGYDSVTCGVEHIPEITLNVRVTPAMRTAVVFSLDERVAGFVGNCDNRQIVVAPDQYAPLLRISAEEHGMTCCGIRFAPASGADAGHRVTELRTGSVFERAGVEVGDRILTINGQPPDLGDLQRILAAGPKISLEVERGDRKLALEYARTPLDVGATLQRVPEGTRVVSVQSGTRAESCGLEAGDIVIRAADRARPTPSVVNDAISNGKGEPLAVLRRDREILLEPRQ